MAIIWRRGRAKVNRLVSTAPPEIRTARESACPLPAEIVEMIIAHLIRDLDALKACSSTCRSWYIVAVPHLHHTLRLGLSTPGNARKKLEPLSKLHELGLMSFVQEIKVYEFSSLHPWIVPQAFSRRDLRYWSAFANVQTLKLNHPEIHRFIPGIERYFEHFSPTLQTITLTYPRCTPRQLSYFLSLFSNLDNIKISGIAMPNTTIPDTELVPFSAPKLRGRLALEDFHRVETWTHLITSCGGLRFHSMDLYGVSHCPLILLEACAETLERLQIRAADHLLGE